MLNQTAKYFFTMTMPQAHEMFYYKTTNYVNSESTRYIILARSAIICFGMNGIIYVISMLMILS